MIAWRPLAIQRARDLKRPLIKVIVNRRFCGKDDRDSFESSFDCSPEQANRISQLVAQIQLENTVSFAKEKEDGREEDPRDEDHLGADVGRRAVLVAGEDLGEP